MRLIAVPLILFLLVACVPFALGETPWLEDYSYRKLITVAGSAGAGTDYVVFVKAYYSDGTDGFEILTGGHNGINSTKVYLDGKVEADFDDVRFSETNGVTELDYFRDSYTASTSTLFAVEVSEDLGSDQSFYIYFGDAGQETESNAAATFRRVISSGIALSLPMNEGSGAVLEDYSGNGYDGAFEGTGQSWVAGKHISAVSFDGNGLVNTGANVIGANQSFSVFAWALWVDDTYYDGVVSEDTSGARDWHLAAQNKATIQTRVYDGVGASKTDLAAVDTCPENVWNHIGLVYDQTVRLYPVTNGVIDAGIASVGLRDNGTPLRIGYMFDNTYRFIGLIAGVFVFNYVLVQAEIDDLYDYYPQCSSANLGSLFLRSFVNPEPQPGSVGSLEVNNRYASTNYVWMAVLLIVGFVFMGFMLLRRGN